MKPIRVLLADDHPIVRAGMRVLLEKDPEIKVIGETNNGLEALQLVRSLSPDVLLLDIEMPGMNGVMAAEQLKIEKAKTYILALSAYDEREYIQALLYTGASGYLLKDEAPEMLIKAVKGAALGQSGWISHKAVAKVINTDNRNDGAHLTARQQQILRCLLKAMSNQEIAHKLQISKKTVEKHVEMIHKKLGLHSRVELAIWAIRRNFDQGPE